MSWRETRIDLGRGFERSASGLFLPSSAEPEGRPIDEQPERPLAADLFSGAGGMSLGFHQAGWNVVAAADGWPTAACTYICNLGSADTRVHLIGDNLPDATKRQQAWFAEHQGETVSPSDLFDICGVDSLTPGSGWIAGQDDEPACQHFYLGDIRSLSGQRIVADVGAELAGVVGGPPCPGYSVAGKQDVMDPRNSLVFDFMRIVCEARPKTFMMENVPGMVSMLTPEGVPVIDAIARIAEDGGFGTFDAIRKSLMSHPDSRAAMRSQPVGRSNGRGKNGARGMALDGRDRAAPDEDTQLSIFGDPA